MDNEKIKKSEDLYRNHVVFAIIRSNDFEKIAIRLKDKRSGQRFKIIIDKICKIS